MGLLLSQLDRLKNAKIPLTIAVDKVAASGGYMMACVADKIVFAPFAIVGSIGVIAQIPNFNKLLKKNDIEFEQVTRVNMMYLNHVWVKIPIKHAISSSMS